MTYPTGPDDAYDFETFQAGAPTTPLPAMQVADAYAQHKESIDAMIAFIQTFVTTTGRIKPGKMPGAEDLEAYVETATDAAVAAAASAVAADASADAAVITAAASAASASAASGSATTAGGSASAAAASAVTAAASAAAAWSTGDAKLTYKTTADAGWVLVNDGTIGDASSSGTTRANADTSALFLLLYATFADGICAVSGGRGANAAADFAAHKTIALPKTLGRVLGVSGTGSGLTARTHGSTVGEENHALTSGENGPHTHPYSSGGNTAGTSFEPSGSTGDAGIVMAAPSSGSGTPHNTMQPTAFLNVMVKL